MNDIRAIAWLRKVQWRSHAMLPFRPRVIKITAASVCTGVAIGLVGGAFRYVLLACDHLRDLLVATAHGWPHLGWLLPVLFVALGAGLARLLVIRFAPFAAGSGVQHVEAVFSGEAKPAGIAVVPVKFFGGILALGTGLALGREGPTVQMGAALASLSSKVLALDADDYKVVQAAGAGAGLAVAFNAPIGGSIFVFEELTESFSPWLLVATLASTSVAIWLMRLLLGSTLEFTVKQALDHMWHVSPFFFLGALLGATGAAYNNLTIASLHLSDRFSRIPSVYRATAIGAVIGLIAWFKPELVGGGGRLTQAVLAQGHTIEALFAIFCLRFILGPFSYAAGTPGGIFTPIMLLGASFGALFAHVLNFLVPSLALSAIACAVVGMGALFTATVRAPITGIVIVVEMTGRVDLTLSLIAASLGAMIIALLLKNEPIYDTLKRRMLQQQIQPASPHTERTGWLSDAPTRKSEVQ